MAGVANVIKVAIAGDAKGIGEAVKEANSSLDRLSANAKSNSQKMGAAAQKGVAVLGAGVLAIAGVAIKNGGQLQEEQDKLRRAIENTGGSWDKQRKAVEAADKAGEKYGYTAAETDDALAQLTRSTGSSQKAQQLLTLAQNVSAATGKPLASSALAVAKAWQGQLKPLKQLGIDLPVAAGGALKVKLANVAVLKATQGLQLVETKIHDGRLKGKAAADAFTAASSKLRDAQSKLNDAQSSGDTIIKALSARLHGSASDASQTLNGKVKALKARFTDITAQIGVKLIPILLSVATWFGKLVDWFSKNTTALKALVIVVGTFIAGMIALSIMEKVQALVEGLQVAWGILNAVMAANPLVLLIASLAALALGIYEAYKHFGPFHDVVQKVWELIQSGFRWVKSNWPLLLAILGGPIGLAVLAIKRNFQTIKDAMADVRNWIRDRIADVVGFFEGLPGRVAGVASHAFQAVKDAMTDAKNWVSDRIGDIVGFYLGLPGRIARFAVGAFQSVKNGMTDAKNWVHDRIEDVVTFVTNLPGRIAGVTGGMFDSISGAFKAAINWIIGAWDSLKFTLPSLNLGPLGHIGGWTIQVPQIPKFHSGGMANFGSAGEGMAVLRNGELVLTPEQQSAYGHSGNTTINLPAGIDPAGVVRAQRRWDRRNSAG